MLCVYAARRALFALGPIYMPPAAARPAHRRDESAQRVLCLSAYFVFIYD